MITWKSLAVAVAVVAGLAYGAAAQSKPACDASRTPQKLEGRVVKVDRDQNKVTVQTTSGTTHEFQAAKETVQDLKVGDRLEATLRSAPSC